MDSKTVITIGRQYGSGGREIGQLVADQLGIKCYDKELLNRAAKESGICEELFENHDEKPTNSFLYSLVMDTYSMGYPGNSYTDMPINHKVFLAQFDSIKKLAQEGPCVIIGRCADYALDDFPYTLSIFIHGDIETRVNRIAGKYNYAPDKARELIQKTDKKRASYYNYYTSKKWGNAEGYHLCIDSGVFGIEGTVALIKNAVATREGRSV